MVQEDKHSIDLTLTDSGVPSSLCSYQDEKKIEVKDILANMIDRQAEEKKIVRALDLRMMPLFCVFYFTDYLDRANIGNAT